MNNLNTVLPNGTFGKAVSLINDNFSLIVNAINSLEHASTKSRGIHNYGFVPSTTTIPNAVSGDWCMVLKEGNSFPADIWTYNGTSWSKGGAWTPEGIDLTDYASKAELTTAIAKSLAQATARMGYCEATISNTEITATLTEYVLPVVPSSGAGNVRIKMPSKAISSGTYTLNINNTGAKTIMYNGLDVSPSNTWDANEVVVVYYANNKYWASNSQGGSADLKVKNTDADLDFADEQDNVVMRLSEGHVKTKNFDSRDVKTFVGDEDDADLDFTDEQGNVLMRVANGHVKTKKFESSTVLTRADLDTLYNTLRVLNHPLHGKKVGFLGDSITYGYGLPENVRLSTRYSSVLCSMVGCTEVNLGVSGTTIASNTINNKNDQRFVTRVTQDNIGDLDFLFVFGGTNDFSYDSKPIGEHFSVNEITPPSNLIGNTQLGAIADTDTFAGGLHDLILSVRAINPNLPMCFLTPLSRGRFTRGVNYTHGGTTYRGARPNMADANKNGNYLYEYEDAIIDITRFYAIPSIRTCSFFNNRATDDGASDLFQGDGDNIHLTVSGNKRLAELLFNWTMNNVVI